ncbi:hypothetical protein B9Z19DRAFT_1121339 [Tuber borchii]|uniref:Uncharacterized protein n=1 Tax=Tuber borchii TaxID=42251 RepID=A0A2T7A315_TUBBO|nr:hypothetical protein B9Z19DRAFT_1121339 [Tuber borchii]
MEPDMETLDIKEDTASSQSHCSQAAGQQGNSGLKTVQISTISGSQEVSLVRHTPVPQMSIICDRAYSSTITGVRSSSPPSKLGAEGAILWKAMTLMLRYTLFNYSLSNAIALTSQMYAVWSKATDAISDAGYIDPLEESLKLLHGKHTTV